MIAFGKGPICGIRAVLFLLTAFLRINVQQEPNYPWRHNLWTSTNEIYGAPIFDVYDDEEPSYDVYDDAVPINGDEDPLFLGFEYFEKNIQAMDSKIVEDSWRQLGLGSCSALKNITTIGKEENQFK